MSRNGSSPSSGPPADLVEFCRREHGRLVGALAYYADRCVQ